MSWLSWPFSCSKLSSPVILPFTTHCLLFWIWTSPRTTAIFTASPLLHIFSALLLFRTYGPLCTFSWFSLLFIFLTTSFLGSFPGIWTRSRDRHWHMFWHCKSILWYIPFLWINIVPIIMPCVCSWSTDIFWLPGSNQSSLANLLRHFFWTVLFESIPPVVVPSKSSLSLLT